MGITRGSLSRTYRTQRWVLAAWIVIVGGVTACTGPSCDDYTAWVNDPDVRAVREKTALWPAVIAEAEKAAAGGPVDTGQARHLSDQLRNGARPLRESDLATTQADAVKRIARPMGLAARLAAELSNNALDQAAAAAALAELRQAIADYEEPAAAEAARCGTPAAT